MTIPNITEGLAISNNTIPVSRSRILKRTKSILYTFASGAHKYPVTIFRSYKKLNKYLT